MPKASKKPRFCDALLKHLSTLEDPPLTLGELRGQLKVKRTTFNDWMRENSFPYERMAAILTAARWDLRVEEVAQAYVIHWRRKRQLKRPSSDGTPPANLMEAFGRLDRQRRDRLDDKLAQLGADAMKLPQSLRKSDFMACLTSTVLPLAFRRDYRHIALAIAQAVAQGAVCVFFTPDDRVIESYEECKFQELETTETFDNGFEWLHGVCVDYLEAKTQDRDAAEREVATHLGHSRALECPIWVPGFVFTLFGTCAINEGVEYRATIRLPDGMFGGLVPLPKEGVFGTRLLTFYRQKAEEEYKAVKKELDQFKRAHPGPSSGKRAQALQALQWKRELYRHFNALVNRKQGDLADFNSKTWRGSTPTNS